MNNIPIKNEELGDAIIKSTAQNVAKQEEFVNRVVDAKKALELAVSTFRTATLDYIKDIDDHLKQARQSGMALTAEHKRVLDSCGDVRKFFLDEKHVEEMKRLKEFVELCERLKALKESGFLEQVTEMVLKHTP